MVPFIIPFREVEIVAHDSKINVRYEIFIISYLIDA